ncbi:MULTISPECIES: hypothetical protein [Novosphingobium]|uniref:hypothetical protein n=1 Tax=Novosphingobium TaxID=165696 RepID=UPI000868C531|nr:MULTISPECIES: hypothetical protein [Novosphingobium]MBN9142960.1 hypothetical protein [Novosphingobium sp.]ODU84894.1 MAG: hypothetical protein ABT10_01175 [Novosphingobium sp. SCN 63-17]WJS99336.1 hypothetical protein NYQ05_04075 [Novosphingobium humi]
MRKIGWMLGLALLACGGCQKAQLGGQTLALVNGEPISRDDVDLELALLPPDQRAGARPRVLQDLIDRKLFAQDARARGAERGVTFVRLERRWHEVLLAQSTSDIIAARTRLAGDSQVEAWLAAHPEYGAKHCFYVIETVKFSAPDPIVDLVTHVRDAAGLSALLAQRNILAARRVEVWDSASLTPEQADLVTKLQAGKLKLSTLGNVRQVVMLSAVQPAPLDRESALALLKANLHQKQQMDALARHRMALRAGARIEWAPQK